MEEKTKETYRYWQDKRINQLGVTNNLILTFCLGVLYFVLDLNETLELETCLNKSMLVLSLVSLFASILFAILLTLNRLKDYRQTAQIVKNRDNKDVSNLRDENKRVGEKTWNLLKCQLWTFFAGILFSSILYITSI